MNNAWKNFFLFRRGERELDAELRDHLQRQIDENIRRGMSPDHARRAALASLGGIEQVKEECRDEKPARVLSDMWRDIRHGIRALAHRPGFTAVAVLTMALGIGANTAVFSVVYGVLIRPLPFANGSRLVVVKQLAAKAGVATIPFSAKEVDDYRAQNRTLEGVAEFHDMDFLLLGGDEPIRVRTGVVSPNFFDLLGVRPALGRTFAEADDRHGAPGVLLLTDRFWREHMGADPKVVGRVYRMNDREHTVIGVLAPMPQYPAQDDIYMPTSHCPFRSADKFVANRNARMMIVFGLLKPGVTAEQARADVATIAGRLERSYPESYPPQYGYSASAELLSRELAAGAGKTVVPLLAAAVFVLLIACASVANLLLARVMKLERELAVRAALGATRGRLIRQLLTESLLLSLAGGALGLVLAPWAVDWLASLATRFSPRSGEIRVDLPVLLFTLGVSLITGVLFGLAPAFGLRRDVSESLKENGRSTDTRGRQRLRKALVVAQLAFSFVLLAGAGLALRSLYKLLTVDAGYHAEHVLVLEMTPSFTSYRGADKLRALGEAVLARAHAIPGVRSAAVAANYPLNPMASDGMNSAEFQIEGRPTGKGELAPRVTIMAGSPGYLETIGMSLVRGRWFIEHDDEHSLQVAVINQDMARLRWPNEDPIGRRITFNKGENYVTIVGIVGNVKEFGLDRAAPNEVYLPLKQQPSPSYLLVRTASAPDAIVRQVTRSIHEAGADIAVDHVRTLDQVRQEATASPRLTALLLGLFAMLALVITAVGLGGVLALGVSQRRQELGIRMALGATHASVVRMVLGQGLGMVAMGIAVGLPASLALTRLIATMLFGVQPNDALTMVSVAGLLTSVAVVACFVPARQATRIDPLTALRSE